jgi:hypothetical protein
MPQEIVQRFYAALPGVRLWIDEYLQAHAAQARAVELLGLKRLGNYYPPALLKQAKTVAVSRVTFPPVEQFGLPEFAQMQQMPFAGITFKDTYFLAQGHTPEELHFHELVHVVQWARLGVDNFLLAYAFGLLQFGYEQSPLEQMAYRLQADFQRGISIPDLTKRIEVLTDAVWAGVAPHLR